MAGGAMTLPLSSYANILGANDTVRIGIIGIGSNIKIGGKGKGEIREFSKIPGVKIAAICDCDTDILKKEEEEFKKRGEQVKTYVDFRELLDDKDIDAVGITTPNHTHAMITIIACQAGKDVYVQKPASHNIWEGRKMVEAAEKYQRVVQVPCIPRSPNGHKEAYDYALGGNLGKILWIHGLNYKPRVSIGKVSGEQKIPDSIDYDLWSGPAPMKPLMREYLHYDWHWDWDTGNGDLGNQGIHYMDGCRMALGSDVLPERVISMGGRWGYDDDGETPNTMLTFLDTKPVPIIFEVRGLPRSKKFLSENWEKTKPISMDTWYGVPAGIVVYCEDGYIGNNSAYKNNGRLIKTFESTREGTKENFINAVRSRDLKSQNATVLDGHLSMALVHMGNISYRLGQGTSNGEVRERIKGTTGLEESFERIDNHLYANRIDLKKSSIQLGPMLTFDAASEKFTGDYAAEANKLVRPGYRKPWVIPDKV